MGASEERDLDIKLAEIIGTLLYNISSSEVRRQVLYKASIIEGMGAFEKRKRDPTYNPSEDQGLLDMMNGKFKPIAVSFVPDGASIYVRRDDR